MFSLGRGAKSPKGIGFSGSLPLKTASIIAASVVLAKLDYCDSLFLNIDITQVNRIQVIHNALVRAVTKTSKHHHITPVLKTLHWLKIPERIEYKVISLTYNTLSALLLPSAVHDPITSIYQFLFHPNTTPPF